MEVVHLLTSTGSLSHKPLWGSQVAGGDGSLNQLFQLPAKLRAEK